MTGKYFRTINSVKTFTVTYSSLKIIILVIFRFEQYHQELLNCISSILVSGKYFFLVISSWVTSKCSGRIIFRNSSDVLTSSDVMTIRQMCSPLLM